MKLLKRIGYYLIGLSLGIVVILFIWKGKDVSFDYGPNARTLKTIRKKTLTYSESAAKSMNDLKIDTTAINSILLSGDVHFGKSKARKKPCAEYYIAGEYNKKNIDFYLVRCDSIATIDSVTQKKLLTKSSFFSSITGRILIASFILLPFFLIRRYKMKN